MQPTSLFLIWPASEITKVYYALISVFLISISVLFFFLRDENNDVICVKTIPECGRLKQENHHEFEAELCSKTLFQKGKKKKYCLTLVKEFNCEIAILKVKLGPGGGGARL